MHLLDPLTAPEIWLILAGAKGSPHRAIKLGLMELLARGAIGLRGTPPTHLVATDFDARALPPTLRSLHDALGAHRADPEVGLELEEVWAITWKVWRRGAAGYAREEILPALRARDLIRTEPLRLLGRLPVRREAHTPAGLATRAEVRHIEHLARHRQPRWARAGIADATEFAAHAGSALLLLNRRGAILRALATERDAAPARATTRTTGEPGGIDWAAVPDPGALAPLLDAFDAEFYGGKDIGDI